MENVGTHNEASADDTEILATIDSFVFALPLSGNQNLVNFKALLSERFVDGLKVGLVRSRNPVGRAVQSAASVVIPGNQSTVRSPVRSAVYSALTPGGGRERNNRNGIGPRIGRGSQALRCPSGFEFGGRFATRGFGNCGRRLFDLPGGGAGGGRSGSTGVLGVLRREGERLGSPKPTSRAVQIERNAQIPRVGGANEEKFTQGLSSSVEALSSPDVSGSLLVRRDGQILRPTVSANVLASITDNPDMQNGALVVSVNSPGSIGTDETPVLWRSGVKKVVFALPGGGSISLDLNGKLTPADKRKLTRAWKTSSNDSDGPFDYGLRLRRFAEESNGKISYAENFPNVDGFNDTLSIAKTDNENQTASVRRWVFSTYLAENAPGRDPKTKPWSEVSESTSEAAIAGDEIKSVADAKKRLDENGNPEEIPAKLLEEALSGSKAFRVSNIRDGVDLLERSDGKKWYRVRSSNTYAHLGERISSDVNGALGLVSSPVKFIGIGSTRDYLVADPQNVGSGQLRRRTTSTMNQEDLLRISVADWLTDNRNRSVDSLATLGSGSKARVVTTSNRNSSLIGLSSDELRKRRSEVLGDYLNNSFNAAASERYQSLEAAQRRILVELYDDLLKRASSFNWDDYTSRLGLDGELSPGEKAHLELVKRLYERRLAQLKSSRKRFLSASGIS